MSGSEHAPRPRRLAAATSLVAAAGALLLLLVVVVSAPLRAVGVVVALVLALMAGWAAVVNRGPRRLLAAAVGLAAIGLVAWDILANRSIWVLVVLVLAVTLSVSAARYALHTDPASLKAAPTMGTPVPAATRPVLIMNLKSGGGKAERFDLEGECRRRGIEPVVLRPGDDLLELAERAVDEGADVVGMAGGDGSQALVATVASRRGVAHVCIPAGTRNHFALDLGLDRDDVVGALDAFGPAVERRIDLATLNDRVFVNNVSLGVYAEVVQSDEYRDDKLGTTLEMLPDLVGPEATPFDLDFDGPGGTTYDDAHIVQVSNNPYDLETFTGMGTRARLDTGTLGIVTLRIATPADVPRLVALTAAGHAERFPGMLSWSAPTFTIRSGGPVAAGVDGEALRIDPPLEFRSLPGALRVRIPHDAPGVAPAAVSKPGWVQLDDLWRVLTAPVA